jgi:hypothetical protein
VSQTVLDGDLATQGSGRDSEAQDKQGGDEREAGANSGILHGFSLL